MKARSISAKQMKVGNLTEIGQFKEPLLVEMVSGVKLRVGGVVFERGKQIVVEASELRDSTKAAYFRVVHDLKEKPKVEPVTKDMDEEDKPPKKDKPSKV
jgi:hypothetical protein